MFYEFPKIETIEDVLPAIAAAPEFIVAEKDGYKVINYMVNMEDTFPPIMAENELIGAMRRECRGSKFDSASGKIIARPYHKFFNVGEREEVMLSKIDLDTEHVRLEKLDGSMIHPMLVNGVIRWCTKMGITDTSMQAEEFVAKNPHYQALAASVIEGGHTPIFEWCSNKNRIVLDYPEDQLILTAVRHMIDGDYYPYTTLQIMSDTWGIPIVGKSESTISEIAALENTEGIVIRFDNGHMLKMKCAWYVLRHKSKDAIMREKNVMEYIFKEQVDDVIPYLTEDDADKLRKFQHNVMSAVVNLSVRLEQQYVRLLADSKGVRRDFAEMNTGPFKAILFKALDGHVIYDLLLKFLASKTGTQTAINEIRPMIGGLKWNY